MSSDLSRSLVDAAEEAIGAAVHMPGSRAQAREAVAAVLETLEADLVANMAACRNARCAQCERAAVAITDFRRLAAEVKSEEDR